jgi:hypothetical protein
MPQMENLSSPKVYFYVYKLRTIPTDVRLYHMKLPRTQRTGTTEAGRLFDRRLQEQRD